MLDKQTKVVLYAINGMITGDEYVIIKLSDLKGKLPFKSDSDGLADIIKFLQKQEMVAVKYMDAENICLTVLPAGRIYLEEQEEAAKKNFKKARKYLFWGLGVFLAAFLGTIIGQLVFRLFESLL